MDSNKNVTANFEVTPVTAGPLGLVMTVNPNPVWGGGSLTVSLTASNQSAGPLNGVQLKYLIPSEAYSYGFYTSSTDGGVCSSGYQVCKPGEHLYWNISTLAVGQSVTKSLSVPLANSISDGVLIHNIAEADYQGGSTVTQQQDVVVANAPLMLGMTVDQREVTSGAPLTYTLKFGNVTGTSVAGTVLDVPLPAGTTFVSASNGGDLNGNTVEWNIGTLAVGESGQRTLEVTANSESAGYDIVAQASIQDSSGDSAKAGTVSVVTTEKSLQLQLSLPSDVVQSGGNEVVSLTVSNQSSGPLDGVQLKYLIPSEAYSYGFYTSSTDGGACSSGYQVCKPGERLYWDIGTLAVGQSVTKSLSVPLAYSISDGVLIYNLAAASSSGSSDAVAEHYAVVSSQ